MGEKFIIFAILYAIVGLVIGVKASRVAAMPIASPNGTTRATRVGWGVLGGLFWPLAVVMWVATYIQDRQSLT